MIRLHFKHFLVVKRQRQSLQISLLVSNWGTLWSCWKLTAVGRVRSNIEDRGHEPKSHLLLYWVRAECVEWVNLRDELSQGWPDNPIHSDSPPCPPLAIQREIVSTQKSSTPALPRKLFSRFKRDTSALMRWQAWTQNNRCKAVNGWPGAPYGKCPAPLKVKDFLRKHKKSQVFVKLLLKLGVV